MLFFCVVCSDMSTCLFYIFIVFFQMIKFTNNMTGYNSREIVIANKQQYQLSPNPPCSFWFFHSFTLFLISIPFLRFFSPVPTLIEFRDATGALIDRSVDRILRYARQLPTFYVLASRYNLASRCTQLSPSLQFTSTCICSLFPFFIQR